MCFISLDRNKIGLFIDALFVHSSKRYRPLSITAADHWCLSLIKEPIVLPNLKLATCLYRL